MINQTALTFPSSQHKALSLGASFLAAATIVGAAHVAQAATFNFSFDNVEGAAPGTVAGTIVLPDGDGTFAATALTITSAPAALGYTTPVDVLSYFFFNISNSFTVSSGTIDASTSVFGAQNNTEAFTLNFPVFGSLLSVVGAGDAESGVVDFTNSTLTYSSITSPTTTPEPSTVLGLLALGSLGALTRKRKG